MTNALFQIDGKPFFSIGGQVNNSTAYSSEHMKRAFAAAQNMCMNTIAAPVYWETMEPEEGRFDFSQLDMLMEQARQHGLKLVILWFGTWKNGNSHYIPRWMKVDHDRFFWASCADGTPVRTISPHCVQAREADCRAFTALCAHVEEQDTQKTVIGIQVENEPGIIGSVRDHGPVAEALFLQPVPEEVAQYAGKGGSWEEVFGFDADEFFTSYWIGAYIEQVVLAGRTVTALPLYTNVWLGEMHNRVPGIDYPSGGAVCKTIPVFRLAAPHLQTISPDIYLQDQQTWNELNRAYQDGVHPYYIPELLPSGLSVGRAMNAVVHHGLCGVHLFGIDMITDREGNVIPRMQEVADGMRTLRAMEPLITRYQGSGKLYDVLQLEGMSEQYIDFGNYIGSVRFDSTNGDPMAKKTDRVMDNRHPAALAEERRGKGLIWYDGKGTFYLAGNNYRLMLFPKKQVTRTTSTIHASDFLNQRCQYVLSVQEGDLDQECVFTPRVRRNGDEADYGFWVTPDIGVLRVEMDTTL